jgi:hypothetical protein
MMLKRAIRGLIFVICLLWGVLAVAASPDYSKQEAWAYWQVGTGKRADCFLICPTVYLGEAGKYNADYPLPEALQQNFIGALNMERGIYEESCTLYAPYYRQQSLAAYTVPDSVAAQYRALAYLDVRRAFKYFLAQRDSSRPFVLAGFSQGAQLCLELLEEFGDKAEVKDKLVACYALGWPLEAGRAAQYPWLRSAQGETDTGVIVSFNSEAPFVQSSLILPARMHSLAINPLNWRMDNTYADKSLNLGACFTDYSGKITREEKALTGAYLDPVRGALKVDAAVTDDKFPYVLDIFSPGVFHLYDYQFFYRNLQKNVAVRLEHFERQK